MSKFRYQELAESALALREQGLKWSEVSERLGRSIGTLASAVFRHQNLERAREFNRQSESRRENVQVSFKKQMDQATIAAWWKARGY